MLASMVAGVDGNIEDSELEAVGNSFARFASDEADNLENDRGWIEIIKNTFASKLIAEENDFMFTTKFDSNDVPGSTYLRTYANWEIEVDGNRYATNCFTGPLEIDSICPPLRKTGNLKKLEPIGRTLTITYSMIVNLNWIMNQFIIAINVIYLGLNPYKP